MHHWFLNELKSCIYSCVKAVHSMSSSRMKPTKCQRYLVENCEWNTISPNGNRINALFCAVSSLISLDVVRMWTNKKKSEWKTNRKEREREKKTQTSHPQFANQSVLQSHSQLQQISQESNVVINFNTKKKEANK